MYRIWKSVTSLSYFAMIWLTWHWAHGGFDMQFSFGCLLVSALWLGLTRLQMGHLLRTYFDILSRLQVILPTLLGVTLSCWLSPAQKTR